MERPIEVSSTTRVPFGRARAVLLDGPGAVFSAAPADGDPRRRRFDTELTVGLGAGASLHQRVTLQLGDARSTERALVLPIAWKATGRHRLFPAFAGELGVSPVRTGTELRLAGRYTVPLGVLGWLGDGVVGRRLAGRSLAALADQLAARLMSEVERLPSVPGQRWPKVGGWQIPDAPEMYVG